MEAIDNYNKAVGMNLRKARVENGKSQEEVGAMLGVTFQQVQKYERALNRVSGGTLMYLAQRLNRPLLSFFDMPEEGDIVLGSGKDSKRTLALVRALDSIDNQLVISKLEKLIFALANKETIAS